MFLASLPSPPLAWAFGSLFFQFLDQGSHFLPQHSVGPGPLSVSIHKARVFNDSSHLALSKDDLILTHSFTVVSTSASWHFSSFCKASAFVSLTINTRPTKKLMTGGHTSVYHWRMRAMRCVDSDHGAAPPPPCPAPQRTIAPPWTICAGTAPSPGSLLPQHSTQNPSKGTWLVISDMVGLGGDL